ncbi:MAG: FHA domain-containing protein [Bradymonadia bacterium]
MADPRKASYALRFIAGKYKGGEFPLRPNREIIIGRNSEYDMVLHEDMVSRRHAKIITLHGKIVLQDLKSTNGTFVNGEKITVARLQVGDRVLVGTSLMQLMEMESTEQTLGIEETPAPAGPPATLPPATMPPQGDHPLGSQPTAPAGGRVNIPVGMDPNTPAPMSTVAAPSQLRAEPIATPAPGFNPGGTQESAAPDHPDLPGLKEAMRGRFPDDDITVADLVELFHAGRRNGVLLVSNDDHWVQETRIFFKEGHLYYATLSSQATDGTDHRPDDPVKALYRTLTWQEGDFRFLTGDALPQFEGHIEDNTRNLLLEGVRQWDELRKFSRHLPGASGHLKLAHPLTPRLSDLSAETLDTLQLILNFGQVIQILNASDASDLETWQDMLYLMQNGYIQQR